jgi:tRNA threonylcarbamoyladenosine biosynthesis protein TsaE
VTILSTSDADTRAAGAALAARLGAGDVVLFEGPLGAGKTTMIRGLLGALGHVGPVRSPTFNLIQTFDLPTPVMHADLYRLRDAGGLGLEDYLSTHISLIEWPDRLGGLVDEAACWRVDIRFEEEQRVIQVRRPDPKC